MGATALPETTDEVASLTHDYWELARKYETALDALRGVYHSNVLEPEYTETIETLFAHQNQPL